MPGSTPDQRDRFVAQWRERFKGVFNSHGVAAVDGDASINKVSETMKDMDMIEGRKFLRDATLEHFNVPREIMGITESSNRATSEAAQYIYAQYVLTPRLQEREDAINQQLLPFFGENLVWHYDDIVPHDKEFDKTAAIENWNAGLITKNQALEMQGLATVGSAGDVYKADISSIFYNKNEDPTKVTSASSQSVFDFGELKFDSKPLARKTSSKKDVPANPTDDGTVVDIYLIYRLCMLLSDNKFYLSVLITAYIYLLLCMWFMVSRPQIFTYVFLLLELLFLENYIKNIKRMIRKWINQFHTDFYCFIFQGNSLRFF